MNSIIYSIIFFILAGFAEIGGGYLIWIWLREGKSFTYGIVGFIVLLLYGVIAAVQPFTFGRVYVGYGGFFVLLSFLWGWKIDGVTPDRFDIIGLIVIMIGVFLIMYYPRN